MMDILMSETCWAHKTWNKIANDIKFVFYSSTITMMHGPINISQRLYLGRLYICHISAIFLFIINVKFFHFMHKVSRFVISKICILFAIFLMAFSRRCCAKTELLLQLRKECKRSFYSKRGGKNVWGNTACSFLMQLKDGSIYWEAELYRCNVCLNATESASTLS